MIFKSATWLKSLNNPIETHNISLYKSINSNNISNYYTKTSKPNYKLSTNKSHLKSNNYKIKSISTGPMLTKWTNKRGNNYNNSNSSSKIAPSLYNKWNKEPPIYREIFDNLYRRNIWEKLMNPLLFYAKEHNID